MKTKIFFSCFIAFAATSFSQVIWSGSTPGTGYTTGTARVGGNTNPGAGTTFHVGDGAATLHYNGGSGGMIIKSTMGDRALLELHDPTGTNKTILQSLSGATWFDCYSGKPLYLNPSGGMVGIGTTSPGRKLHISTGIGEDGIRITQTTSGGSALYLENVTSSGHNWALLSYGITNTQGSGNFGIYDYSNMNDRFFIRGSSATGVHAGNVGIGTVAPGYAKLSVVNENPVVTAGVPITKWAIRGSIEPKQHKISDGFHESEIGVEGDAFTSFTAEGIMYGVVGKATNGLNNYGGYFEATQGDENYAGAANFGVRAKANGNWTSYGIFAEGGGSFANNYAGWFQGDVVRTGVDNFTSDRKLKNDIKPLANAMDILMKLKPSTYTFKVDEYKSMNLPRGKQMGLIAQDLETVLPELVRDMPEMSEFDKDGNKRIITPEFKAVQYIALIPLLISGLQEERKLIETQTQTINELKTLVTKQQEEIKNLTNRAGSATAVNPMAEAILEGFTLEQNIPNPFSGETVIKYTLPQQVRVASLIIYDLSGKQITSFPITAEGPSSIAITSEKIAAGIYIYSVMADGIILDSKRMVVAEK